LEAADGRYELASLVRGEENILAISAVSKVVERPCGPCNPLFLFGPSSVGKTHLLYALRDQLEQRYPQWNILIVPAGEFLDECEQAWQNNRTIDFRRQLWKLDCLMIDDVHLLADRPSALEEIYHTFNRFMADSKLLVFTSREPPVEMNGFPLALRSRLSSGLVVPIESPRERLMRDIVEQKCQQLGLRPSRSAANVLCKEVRSVRELEGIVNQLGQNRNGRGRELSASEVRSILRSCVTQQLTIGDIARRVCQYFHIDLARLRSACRQHGLVQARQVAMFLARELTATPLVEIGRFFGGRDHTTVLYAYRKTKDALRNSPYLARAVREIRDELKG
jgi:chromosomal replication initiator protein